MEDTQQQTEIKTIERKQIHIPVLGTLFLIGGIIIWIKGDITTGLLFIILGRLI